jgi:GNAT superfamily N-acetyltransferase
MEPRAPQSQEFQNVVNFFTENLRAGKGWSIADEYPLAINSSNLENVRVIEKDGRILSGAVLKTSLVKSPAGLFKLAGIGSVVTDPAHRHQGLSRAILDATLESARASACDIAILWTDLFDFYRKIGFELGGSEVVLKLKTKLIPKSPELLHYSDSKRLSPDGILRLYGQHTCGALRSAEDIRKSLLIPQTRVFTAWDDRQVLQAYAILGKGADFTDYIHEWGGSVSKIIALLSHIQGAEKQEVSLIAPSHSRNLIRQLEGMGAESFQGVLGMIKILNPDLLFSKLRRYARQLGLEDFVIDSRQGVPHFGFGEKDIFRTDSSSDLVRLIFGPTRARDLHGFDESTALKLEKIFPIPFWVWGWDSV